MKLPIFKHEDDRRLLVEYVHDIPTRNIKVLYIKQDSVLGKHYHKLKDDIFYLIKGSGKYILDEIEENFVEGDSFYVPRGVTHTLKMKAGSIIIESSSEPYEKGDEHEIS